MRHRDSSRTRRAAAGAVALASLAIVAASPGPTAADRTLTFRDTLYVMALQSDYPGGWDAAFVDARGRVLARGSSAFVRAAMIQGTAKLNDGRVLNIIGKVDGSWRWKLGRFSHGHGATCPMLPYRTAAVDPKVVPLGSVLYIPRTRGMRLPDGTRHDGLWYALDTGQAIRGNRIDLFAGAGRASMRRMTDLGLGRLRSLKVQIRGRVSGCPGG